MAVGKEKKLEQEMAGLQQVERAGLSGRGATCI